jgi:predicted ATP-dependent endonuclease of OLD family
LILVDEPELSLHIEWQINYVDELLEIIKIVGFYSVLATHSPQIIHDNWDLTIALENIK